MVKLWIGPAERDIRANYGRVMRRTDDGKDSEEWEFEKLDGCRKNEENGWWEYYVVWVLPYVPEWQPRSNLEMCPEEVRKFYRDYPEAPVPPAWAIAEKSRAAQERRKAKLAEREQQRREQGEYGEIGERPAGAVEPPPPKEGLRWSPRRAAAAMETFEW